MLNDMLKCLFFIIIGLNVFFCLVYVFMYENFVDVLFCRFLYGDYILLFCLWEVIEQMFGKVQGYMCDFMVFDLNVM